MSRRMGLRIVAAAAALGVVIGAIGLLSNRAGAGTMTLTTYFTKAIGLFPSSSVRVLGVSVGKVVSVKPEGPRVRVVMSIEASRRIPADARATIVPISIIADRYIQLDPPYTSGPFLGDGDVIGEDRTSVPVELDDVLAQVKRFLDAVETGVQSDPKALGTAVKNAAFALQGTGGDLDKALSGAGSLADAIVEQQAHLEPMLVHLSHLESTLAERGTDITQLNANLARALGAIEVERASLDGAISNLAVLTEELGSLLQDHRASLESDISTLAKYTRAVVRHQDALVETLDWFHVVEDAFEEGHNGGAAHSGSGGGPDHVDVREAHLFACPPNVPPLLCVVLGLAGQLPAAQAPAAGSDGPVAPRHRSPKPPLPIVGDLPSIIDRLPRIRLSSANWTAYAYPGSSVGQKPPPPAGGSGGAIHAIQGFFEDLGGFVDRAVGWFL